jgi:hypothetical protein
MDKPKEWKIRIVGHGEEDPTDLLANPRNWRIHPKVQQDALEGVLDDVGWVDEIIVNQRTGFVVDGHLRVSLAISNEMPAVPVKYVDLTEEEEMAVLATLDPIAAMAVTDLEQYTDLVAQIDVEDERVADIMKAMEQRDIQAVSGAFERPDFSGVVEEFGETRKLSDKVNEQWFYVEFYQDETRYTEVMALLEPYFAGQSKHVLDPDFFYNMVKTYVTT